MTNDDIKIDPTHKLYCPACKKAVLIPYATEISSRSCPACGAGADTMWPSEAMYLRDASIRERLEAETNASKKPEKINAPVEPVKKEDESLVEKLERRFIGGKKK